MSIEDGDLASEIGSMEQTSFGTSIGNEIMDIAKKYNLLTAHIFVAYRGEHGNQMRTINIGVGDIFSIRQQVRDQITRWDEAVKTERVISI